MEVLVAISLIMVMGSAAAAFTITAIHTSEANEARSKAVLAASSSLETVQTALGAQTATVDPLKTITGLDGTVSSSTSASTSASTCTASERAILGSGVLDSSSMKIMAISADDGSYSSTESGDCSGSDAGLDAASDGSMHVYTVVGTCVRAVGSTVCNAPSGGGSSGSSMLRVVAVVVWPDVSRGDTISYYTTSMLVDATRSTGE